MLRLISIQGFRGFRELSIDSLERVNLIAGKNNVGKTAILEALYLLANPVLSAPPRLNLLRGFDKLKIDLLSKWGWLFFERNTAHGVVITSRDSSKVVRTVRLTHGDGKAAQQNGLSLPATLPMFLTYTDSTSFSATLRLSTDMRNIPTYENESSYNPLPYGVFLGFQEHSIEETAERFSRIAIAGRETEITTAIRVIEPRIRQLDVYYIDGVPMLYADIGMKHPIPIQQMGDGMLRLLAILMEMPNAENGIMLVDEIENGIHHSALVDVWNVIGETARLYNAQVFATTHSWECIRAAHEAFSSQEPYDFALHRLERIDGEITAVTYNRETLEISREMELEVR